MTDPEARDPYAPPPEDGGPDRPPPPPYGGPPPPYQQPPPQQQPPYHQPPQQQQPYGHAPYDGRPPRRPDGPVDGGGRRALWLALGGVFATVVVPPLGLCLGVAAIVVAMRAFSRAGASNGRAPGAIPAVVVGGFVTAASLIVTVLLVVFFDEVRDYRDCLSGAGTHTAQDRCRDDLERRLPAGFSR